MLCNHMDCSLPGSSVHGDSPGKNTGVGCMPSSRGSSQPRDQTQVSHTAGGFFTIWATSSRKRHNIVIIIPRFNESKSSAHFLAEIKLLQALTLTGRMPSPRGEPWLQAATSQLLWWCELGWSVCCLRDWHVVSFSRALPSRQLLLSKRHWHAQELKLSLSSSAQM